MDIGIKTINLDYSRPVNIAEDIYWVGFSDHNEKMYCNPYLIIDGDEAVLLDGGSRPDFSTVMRKILQTGIAPGSISHLIYHHYDPDLCGNIPNLEEIIDRSDLKIISKKENNAFIKHYSVQSELICMDDIDRQITLKSGRKLRFIATPYAHSAGAFVTFDEQSKILFSSDIFGSLWLDENTPWELFQEYDSRCKDCKVPLPDVDKLVCDTTGFVCPIIGFCEFNKKVMPSNAALRYALDQIRTLSISMIAPQHGSLLFHSEDIQCAINRLYELEDVGIDGILRELKDA